MTCWPGSTPAPSRTSSARCAPRLACITLDLPLVELERLNQDELAWETRVMQFRGYRETWRKQGVLAMLRRLLHDFELPQALMART
jgi:exodeoxyribonuclease V beta subunit